VRVSELTLPDGVTTDIDSETAVALGQPPRVVVEEATGEGEGEEVAEAAAGAEPGADASAEAGSEES
jgi:hypothetical protein